MASRAQSIVVTYVAWNTSTQAGATGDVANHTLRVVKDGTSGAPTNSPAEVDATNAPGVYKLTLTASECTADCVTVAGKSSTANVTIIPLTVTFEQLPTVAAGGNGGLPTGDASGRVLLQPTQTGVTIPTVTTLSNLPAITTDWITAAGVSAAAVTKIQAGLSTYAGGDTTGVTTLLTRVGGAITISGGKVAATMGATDYSGNTVQTGDAYARIGVAGGGLTALGDARLANLDAAVSSRLATGSYTTPPTATQIRQEMDANSADLDAIGVLIASVKLKTDGLPADPAGLAGLASAHGAGNWATAAGFSTLTAGDIPTTAQIADKVLGRSIAGGADGGRTVRDALRFLRNKWTRTGSLLSVYAEDDVTLAWTSVLVSSSSLSPVGESDPT